MLCEHRSPCSHTGDRTCINCRGISHRAGLRPGRLRVSEDRRLKRAVQRNRSVRRAAVLVIAHLSAVEIEVSIGLIANLAGERDDRRNLPVKTSACPNLAVGNNCLVEARDAVSISKLIVYTEGRVPHGCPYINRYISGEFVLQTRRWQDGIEQPLWP